MRPYGSGTVENFRGKHRARAPRQPDKRRPVLGVFDTPEEAHAECDAHCIVTNGAGIVGGTLTLRLWGKKYLDRRETGTASGQEERARNIKTDRSRWKLHIDTADFADWPLHTISRREIKDWLNALGRRDAADVRAKDPKKRKASSRRKPRKLSAQTRKHCLNLLRKALDEAVEDEFITVNPAAGVKAPKIGELDFDWLRLAEQNAIEHCAKIDEADRLRAMFAWGTGIRQFDQWAMKLSDLRLKQENPDVYFWCHKLGKRMRVPLFGVALRAIRRWLELLPAYCEKNERGLVWPLPSGCQRQKSKTYGWPAMLKAAGIKRHVKWHELRDTCASSLVSGLWGNPPRPWRLEEVRDMLGHSSIEVTERYAHLAPQVLDEAARETDCHHSAIIDIRSKMRSRAKNKGRATPDSDRGPSAPEAAGKNSPALELTDTGGRLMAMSVALIRAQTAGDVTSATTLGLDLATGVIEALAAARAEIREAR